MDSPTNLEDGKTWIASGRTSKELAGEPPPWWGGRPQKCSWGTLPAAHMATKSRLWWWQWAMGVLFLEALTCRLPGTDNREWLQGKETHSQLCIPIAFSGNSLKSSWDIPSGFQQAAEGGAWELLSKLLLLQMNWHGERSEESPFGEPGLKQKG